MQLAGVQYHACCLVCGMRLAARASVSTLHRQQCSRSVARPCCDLCNGRSCVGQRCRIAVCVPPEPAPRHTHAHTDAPLYSNHSRARTHGSRSVSMAGRYGAAPQPTSPDGALGGHEAMMVGWGKRRGGVGRAHRGRAAGSPQGLARLAGRRMASPVAKVCGGRGLTARPLCRQVM